MKLKYGIAKTTTIIMLSAGLLSVGAYAATTSRGDMTEMQMATKNKSAGEAFLAANKIKPGVVTLSNGLQYKVIEQGKGEKPTKYDTVTVDYAGTLIDGSEFDSSFKRGVPASFPVNGVIAGWTQALQLMPVGSTWELYIPSSLAYGEQGMPPVIGPNETLIFKVTLKEIKKS